jgi:hypothetical protein
LYTYDFTSAHIKVQCETLPTFFTIPCFLDGAELCGHARVDLGVSPYCAFGLSQRMGRD